MAVGPQKSQLTEFNIIEQFFSPLAHESAAFGLKDDAAQFQGQVLTKDVIIESVHFFQSDPAFTVAQKALRVNLSDLAAKGATPSVYLMALALPEWVDSEWLHDFSQGLQADQDVFGIKLLGGDTVRTPGPLTVSITMIGTAPKTGMIRRNGAQVGDKVVVTGEIGDGWLGLHSVQNGLGLTAEQKYRVPQPRVRAGMGLSQFATASADVSDGLLADALTIADTSGVRCVLDSVKIPLSSEARQWLYGRQNQDFFSLITGGDDFELLFTVSSVVDIATVASHLETEVSVIGRIEAGRGICLLDHEGCDITPHENQLGYTHGVS